MPTVDVNALHKHTQTICADGYFDIVLFNPDMSTIAYSIETQAVVHAEAPGIDLGTSVILFDLQQFAKMVGKFVGNVDITIPGKTYMRLEGKTSEQAMRTLEVTWPLADERVVPLPAHSIQEIREHTSNIIYEFSLPKDIVTMLHLVGDVAKAADLSLTLSPDTAELRIDSERTHTVAVSLKPPQGLVDSLSLRMNSALLFSVLSNIHKFSDDVP